MSLFTDENNVIINNGKVMKKRAKTVEERYQKKTQIEHILLRPDTYIGSIEYHEQSLWVWDEINNKMVYKLINYVPGLYKIFDEILVNAADVKAREISMINNERCTCIKVDISKSNKRISIFNDGDGIPVEIHKEYGVYVPELIFGHLLTSDNYDDNEDRVTGGRNGFGAKLTNIFSTEFCVECADSNSCRLFKMTWFDNMSKKTDAIVTNYNGKSYVKISFKPDLDRFANMREFDGDILSLLYKRVYDIAGTSGVKVYLNGSLLPIKDFKSYTLLYLKSKYLNTHNNLSEEKTNSNSPDKENNEGIVDENSEQAIKVAARTTRAGRNILNKKYNDKTLYDEDIDDIFDDDDEWEGNNRWKQGKKNTTNKLTGKMKTTKARTDNATKHNFSLSLNGINELGNNGTGPLIIYEDHPKWEIVISESDGQFQHVSFVNSICTIRGGTHISYILDPLIAAILKRVQTKNKGGIDIKNHHVKSHIWIFIRCLIVNPSFDSQTKETLTTKVAKFGSTCQLSEKTINSVVKSPIVENVLMWAQMRQSMELKKKMKTNQKNSLSSRLLGIPKLEDANEAGGPNSRKCTLILTEGDSAKTSCLAGLSIVGRDYYGVFPLKGKLLNVREASFKQQIGNIEIQNILKILGISIGTKYENGPINLRYGSLMLMTDQDHDGSHIKGLIINLIHYYWPSLVHFNGFLKQFVTPIVKAKKGNQELSFFTLVEYDKWRKESNPHGWKIKYYKGLGTSTDLEFKEYFTNIENHSIEFDWYNDEDDEAIDMAFSKKRTEDRKKWIESYQEGTYIDYSMDNICRSLRYRDFIDKELVLFSRYDTARSIPNVIDGLKPGQRKVLYSVFKKKLNNEMKVAQLAGYVAEHSAYHHGEASLQSTIVNMAQDFVGSNNLNLLQPCGQFGSRKEGGKDASAARYIFTKLSTWTRYIFPEADDPLLIYLQDDGQQIEPLFYVPIIPMVLVNGADGIGTGWSCSVPNYNPKDIINNLKRALRGDIMMPMTPWYRSFKGKVTPIKQKNRKNLSKRKNLTVKLQDNNIDISHNNGTVSHTITGCSQSELDEDHVILTIDPDDNLELGANYETFGNWYRKDDETLIITELPVRRWTQDYKEWLESTLLPPLNTPEGDDIDHSWIMDYRDNSSHDSVHITIRIKPDKFIQAENEGIEKVFKLKSTLSTSNMTLFDNNSHIVRYETELDILKEFIPTRLQMYEKRKRYLLSKLNYERVILEQKILFLNLVIEDRMKISNKSRSILVQELKKNNLKSLKDIQLLTEWNNFKNVVTVDQLESNNLDVDCNNEQIPCVDDEIKEFDYLLSLPLWSLTTERMELLKDELNKKIAEYNNLKKTSIEDLWNKELDELLSVIECEETKREVIEMEHKKLIQKRRLSIDWSDKKSKGKEKKRKKSNSTKLSKYISKKSNIFYDNSDDYCEDNIEDCLNEETDEDFISIKKTKSKTKSNNNSISLIGGLKKNVVNKSVSMDSRPKLGNTLKNEVILSSTTEGIDSKQDGNSSNSLESLSLLQRLQQRYGSSNTQGPNTATTLNDILHQNKQKKMTIYSTNKPIELKPSINILDNNKNTERKESLRISSRLAVTRKTASKKNVKIFSEDKNEDENDNEEEDDEVIQIDEDDSESESFEEEDDISDFSY
ncbi:DNA gyrase/topoisomerase IV, A subunit family protein [Cryptosporidium muris RN66]|uniref:DNA topoisomerase 2 n=1 Tax=Cryptosporidium muris (strain RN66) TaxID=441375 RepID=B6AEK2_CRYMR|nr:DNA gyrase/topoisomerase IV, A subunit family protein [Cryptosporidium muris RN66]EEA06619.1 DNA gyrase/topoisomerase IV, A subunit family protein [Cryptosporidium muris RN66]|eukprot:XP_002140968.1 DNA gyrase/topoisomerase IV, A subunit family protein [Cryptosporidium muris RN66]